MREELKITFEPDNEAAKQFVTDGIGNYNIAVTGRAAWYPVAYFVRSPENEILGGLHGAIWAKDWQPRKATIVDVILSNLPRL